jgi:pimeloyl-ACP methyl ester carboxylesterase
VTGPSSNDYGPQGRSAWMDVDWRAHQRWVPVEDRWANVVEIGSGPPVLFIHGLGGSWQNWLENLPAVAEAGYRAIAVDLPGFGASPLPRDRITISDYGQWVDVLLGELGLDAVAVVGNSMGGFIGAELAISFPQRVERLALVAAAGISIEHQRNDTVMEWLYRTESATQMLVTRIAGRSEEFARRPGLRTAALLLVAAHPAKLPAPLVAEQIRGAGRPGFLPALEALTTYPIRDRLTEIACPTLIVWGREDRLVPVRDADTFDELIPDSRKVIFDDTGHVPQMERPARFNRLLADFLAERPGEEVDETSEAAVGD